MKILIALLALLLCSCNQGGGESGGGSSGGGSASAPGPDKDGFVCPSNHHDTPAIIAFGDSIAAYANNFPTQFAAMVGMPLQNFAVGGTSMFSDNQYKTIMCVEINSDDIVLFQPGTNDAWIYGNDAGYQAQYQHALSDILTRLDRTHAIVLFGTTSHEIENVVFHGNSMTNALLDVYGNFLKNDLTNTHYDRIHLVDIAQSFIPDANSNMTDNVHPNAVGFGQIAQQYLTVFQGI